MSLEELKALLDWINETPTECDGATRFVSKELHDRGITHTIKAGFCQHIKTVVEPHFWVEVEGFIVDYRLKMWVTQSDKLAPLPNGVFRPEEFPQTVYDGEEIHLEILPDGLYELMKRG